MSYAPKIIEANVKADPTNIGVRLGAVCIAKDVPVMEVAYRLEVSRMTVYNWFMGKNAVSRHLQDRVNAYLDVLNAA